MQDGRAGGEPRCIAGRKRPRSRSDKRWWYGDAVKKRSMSAILRRPKLRWVDSALPLRPLPLTQRKQMKRCGTHGCTPPPPASAREGTEARVAAAEAGDADLSGWKSTTAMIC